MLKMFKQTSIVLLAVAAFLVWLPSSANAVTFTGCLTNAGSITKMQAGDLPTSPCTANQQQISLNSEGPQGPKGDTGDDGAQGPKGDTGDSGVGGGGDLFEFVGYSGNVVNGGVGYDGLTAECADTFGADARVSTTEEYIKSTLIAAPATPAWINPVLVNVEGVFLYDYSGFSRTEFSWNCRRWGSSSSGDAGMVLETNGSLSSETCDKNNIVTCSAPPL